MKGAKIEYLGSFAEMQDKGKSKITSEAINPSSKSVSDASRSKSTDANQTNIDKGLAGL